MDESTSASLKRPSLGRVARATALALLLVLASAGSTVPGALANGSAAAATVTLDVLATGTDGKVHVSAGEDCDRDTTRQGGVCSYPVEQGATVTLRPESTVGFVGWSVYECPGTDQCALKVDSDRTVVATFTPTSLTVDVRRSVADGADEAVTSKDGKIDCGDICTSDQFAAFAEVTLRADPADRFDRWSGACQEAGKEPTCTLLLSGDDVVGAKFDGAEEDPEIIPQRQKVPLQVVIDPAGSGRVTSSRSRFDEAINCAPGCGAKFEQGEAPRLTAEGLGGAHFLRWVGGAPYCTTNADCRYPAMAITSIRAVFEAPAPPPAEPPPAPTNPPPQTPPPTEPSPPEEAPPARCEKKLVGTPGRDRIDGGPGGDILVGGRGNDRLRGLRGDDCLDGGPGNDILQGGAGNDVLRGRGGNDTLVGGPGKDMLLGGPGNDRIRARDGARDTIVCGPGRDIVQADRSDRVRGCERRR